MATTEWSAAFEGTPGGATSRKLGDDRIRELKLSIRERLTKGGHFMQDSGGGFPKDGRHVVGVGDGPTIYKSDATTEAVRFTDTNIELKAGVNITSVDGLNGSVLKPNAITTPVGTLGTIAGIGVTSTANSGSGSIVLGNPKGQVLWTVAVLCEGLTADNDALDIALQFDRLNSGVWTDSEVASGLNGRRAGLFVPTRTSAAHKLIIHTLNGLDPMTTSSAGGTVNYRVQFVNNHATATLPLVSFTITLIELKR